MLSGDFDRLTRGEEVSYVEEVGDTGPIASKVRVKERSLTIYLSAGLFDGQRIRFL